ncbi:MAG: serine/threonine-protein kinase, partial [Gemmatimonadota bacterium]
MTSPSPDRIGSVVADRYEIRALLGEGGMARVYAAHDRKHDRQVAIKMLRAELTVALGTDRFLREIRIAARLTHPHILPLYDSGEDQGALYYVMPLIEGESLRERLASHGPLPLLEASRITHEVAEALTYAHEQGFVHRDIKPDNIMLARGHA